MDKKLNDIDKKLNETEVPHLVLQNQNKQKLDNIKFEKWEPLRLRTERGATGGQSKNMSKKRLLKRNALKSKQL